MQCREILETKTAFQIKYQLIGLLQSENYEVLNSDPNFVKQLLIISSKKRIYINKLNSVIGT